MRRHDVLSAVTEPRVDHRGEPAERVDHGQDAQLATRRELVVNEVHGPYIVRPNGRRTILTQLRLHPPLGRVVAQLQPQLLVKPVYLHGVHNPAFPTKDVIDTAIAIAGVRLTNAFDALLDRGRIGATGLVVAA